MRACAFVCGHITGFFSIHDETEDVRKRGSKGCGICLTLGVNTEVDCISSKIQKVDIFINGKNDPAPATRLTIEKILGGQTFEVRVTSELDLPQGQGFGMSGAGALSASLALNEALNLDIPEEKIVCAAHEAEILCATGLGDVTPQSHGGVVIRKKEGCPPFGIVENIESQDPEIVLCVVGKELSTKEIISDPDHRIRITKYGEECLGKLSENPSLEEMMHLSISFSKRTELLSPEVKSAIDAASEFGMASMTMLGNSLFAMGDTQKLVNVLIDFGDVYVCKIDKIGGRILKGD